MALFIIDIYEVISFHCVPDCHCRISRRLQNLSIITRFPIVSVSRSTQMFCRLPGLLGLAPNTQRRLSVDGDFCASDGLLLFPTPSNCSHHPRRGRCDISGLASSLDRSALNNPADPLECKTSSGGNFDNFQAAAN